jgi:hypothetical protein
MILLMSVTAPAILARLMILNTATVQKTHVMKAEMTVVLAAPVQRMMVRTVTVQRSVTRAPMDATFLIQTHVTTETAVPMIPVTITPIAVFTPVMPQMPVVTVVMMHHVTKKQFALPMVILT